MSTRAIYSFEDEGGTVHVYKHHDGYPTGAADAINAAIPYAWPLPRWEADEFAASFVAANKLPNWLQEPLADSLNKLYKDKTPDNDGHERGWQLPSMGLAPYYGGKNALRGGGVRLIPQGREPHMFAGDAQYRYLIKEETKRGKPVVYVTAFSVDYWGDEPKEEKLFKAKLTDFKKAAEAWEFTKENA